VCQIKLRCPDGSEISRNWHRDTATISDVVNFFKVSKKSAADFNLMNSYPKKILNTPEQMPMTLASLNMAKKVMMIVANK